MQQWWLIEKVNKGCKTGPGGDQTVTRREEETTVQSHYFCSHMARGDRDLSSDCICGDGDRFREGLAD